MHHPGCGVVFGLLTLSFLFFSINAPHARQNNPQYALRDLGQFVVPTGLSGFGYPTVVGYRWLTDQRVERAIAGFPEYGFTTYGTLGGSNSFGRATTSGGTVVGEAQTANHVYHAFVTGSNGLVDLGTLGGANSGAYGINDQDVIVGFSETASRTTVAFIYRDGAMSPLGASLGGPNSVAVDINERGQVVGHAELPSPAGATRAFLYENGFTTNLGTLGGSSVATAINDPGTIVGYSLTARGGAHAFRWETGAMQDLGTLGGTDSYAAAINADGTIGGWSLDAQGRKRAVIWRDGQIIDVNTLVQPGSDWVLEEITGVGLGDTLVGWGRRADGTLHGFIAVPPVDLWLSISSHWNDQTTNIPNPHEAGDRIILGASVFNNGPYGTATGVKVRSQISGPFEFDSWNGDCVREGQTLTCTLPAIEAIQRTAFYWVRATAPGTLTHTASIIASDLVDGTPGNNSSTETNTAVSLASFAVAESTVTGGKSVLSRVTLTGSSGSGGAYIDVTSSRPDVVRVPTVSTVPWVDNGISREFYIWTKSVTAPVTAELTASYGLHTYKRSLTVMPAGTSWPHGGTAHPVPGLIQSEDYDSGGQNGGYFDTTRSNNGDVYRDDDVDIQPTTDAGGGYNVGWIAPTEWLQYTVSVARAGTYRLELRVAANGAGGRLHVEFNGVDKTGPINIPNTGGWQTWTTIGTDVALPAGSQRMRLVIDAASAGVVGNLNHMTLRSLSATSSTPYSGSPIALPGTVQAENFDNGGANVAYRDTTAGNSGGVYRPAADVDIEGTSDSGGGHNVGWMAPGEWLDYTVNVGSAANYRLDLRVAANGAGGRLHVEFDGVDKTGPLTIPNTGGWQRWTTLSAPVTLAAGTARMRVVVDAAGPSGVVGNLNFIHVAGIAPPTPPPEIVIYASDIPDSALHGAWSKGSDAGSPSHVKLQTPNGGFAAINAPLVSPTQYLDVTFNAVANTPYTLWLRLKAENDDKYNDAVWVQFSGAHANGGAVFGLNTTSGLLVNLATDGTAASLESWGWANDAYWLAQPTTFRFPGGGVQTLRIQVREDGVQLDQIVLSPKAYLSAAPGGPTNDATVVAK